MSLRGRGKRGPAVAPLRRLLVASLALLLGQEGRLLDLGRGVLGPVVLVASLEEEGGRVRQVVDDQDDEEGEADGRQDPGGALVGLGLVVVLVDQRDQAQAEREERVERGAEVVEGRQALRARHNVEHVQQEEDNAGADEGVVELERDECEPRILWELPFKKYA